MGGVANAALVAHYTFDGNINDSSGNGRNLAVNSIGYAVYGAAHLGANSFSFSGSTELSYVGLPAGGSGTFAFWWGGSDPGILSALVEATAGGSAKIYSGEGGELIASDFVNYNFILGPGTFDGAWHHIAVTFNGANTAKIYIDGVLTALTIDQAETMTLGGSLYVGGDVGGDLSAMAIGLMDDLQIYDAALTAGEIATVMDGGTIGAPTVSAVSTSAVASTTATLNATSSQTGTGYWAVLLAANANTPDATHIILGQDQSSTAAIAFGNVAMTAATAKALSMTGLTAGTAYKVYFTAQASGLNSTVSSSLFTTTAAVLTIEDSAPVVNGGVVGDGNGDATADSSQAYVDSSLYGGTNWVTVASATLTSTVTVTQSAVSAGLIPSNLLAPAGKFAVNIAAAAATETISLFIPYNANIDRLYKLNRTTGVYDLIPSAITHYPADNKTKIVYSVVDGSVYDQDGAANGAIQDPVIPAGAGSVGSPLSKTAYIFLAFSFLFAAWHGNRRRELNANSL